MGSRSDASGRSASAETCTAPYQCPGRRGLASLALLALCWAGSALAQTSAPTLEDLKRMGEEWDRSHQRTLKAIEDAKASFKPASEFAHLPPDSVALAAYTGRTLLSVESGYGMRVMSNEDGTPRVVFVNIDATPVGGFGIGAKQAMATAGHSLYDIQQIAFSDCPANGQPRTAAVNRDGSGVAYSWSCGGDRRGKGRQFHGFSLAPDGPGVKARFVVTTAQGTSNTYEYAYLPITDELLAAAVVRLKERQEEERKRQEAIRLAQQEEAREKRRASQERVRAFNRAMENINGVLQEVAAENGTYEDAQARMDATVADIQANAAAERQARSMGPSQPAPVVPASQPQRRDPVASAAAEPRAQAGQHRATAPPSQPAKPLRFVLSMSMRNLPGDKVNSTCYSNVITRDGPPGWGGGGFLPPGSGEQARETIYELKDEFIAQCRASGREITSEGNFNFQWNQTQGDEQRIPDMRPRHREDVSVVLN